MGAYEHDQGHEASDEAFDDEVFDEGEWCPVETETLTETTTTYDEDDEETEVETVETETTWWELVFEDEELLDPDFDA